MPRIVGRDVCQAASVELAATEHEQAFRADVRSWLVENLPWEYGHGLPPRFEDLAQEVAFLRAGRRDLADGRGVGRGLAHRVRRAWGGGPTEHFIVQEELARARAPEMVGRIGLNLAAPTLLTHGTEEQRSRWLARIRSAEDLWCQLFSEPGAGSDLAGLSTRAVRVEGAGGSAGRRSGPRTHSSPTGGSAWPGPTRRPPSTAASPTWWWTCTLPGSR